jgi:hypothetical protein
MIALALFAALTFSQQPQELAEVVIMSSERRVADPWTQSVRATCGPDTLEITGYGAGRPLDREAEIRMNGRLVAGADVARMAADLSFGSAVYRFQMRCGHEGFDILVNRGEAQVDEPVRYETARATFQGGELVLYSGMETAGPEGFWFR